MGPVYPRIKETQRASAGNLLTMTIDENSLRCLRMLTNEEIAVLAKGGGGDFEAFEVRIAPGVHRENLSMIKTFLREKLGNANYLMKEEDERFVYIFIDFMLAFEFKIHCG